MKQYIVFFIFSISIAYGQIPPDSISYDYFYPKQVDSILELKTTYHKTSSLDVLEKIGDLYSQINISDSALHYKIEHYKIAKKMGLLQPKHILDIHKLFAYKDKFDKDDRYFLEEYSQHINSDKTEEVKANYLLEKSFDYVLDSSNVEKGKNQLKLVYQTRFYKNSLEFQTRIIRYEGYIANTEKNYQKADSLYHIYLHKVQSDPQEKFYILVNIGINFLHWGKPNMALQYLNKAEKIKIPRYSLNAYQVLYQNLVDCYKTLHQDSIANTYQQTLNRIDSLSDDVKINYNFYEIDRKYKTEVYKEKLTIYEKVIQNYEKYKFLYIGGLFVTFFLFLYSFIRWKKSDNQKQIIRIEKEKIDKKHQETVKEVEKIKRYIEDDSIILKNKTTVSIKNIRYIQVDGHYLHLILLNRKEFVRGKLSEILEELPSNFVQIHRSYVVNKNYIVQVLSREVVLKGGDRLPRSRNHFRNIFDD